MTCEFSCVFVGGGNLGQKIAAAAYLKNFTRRQIEGGLSSLKVDCEFKNRLMEALLQVEPAVLKVLVEAVRARLMILSYSDVTGTPVVIILILLPYSEHFFFFLCAEDQVGHFEKCPGKIETMYGKCIRIMSMAIRWILTPFFSSLKFLQKLYDIKRCWSMEFFRL